MNRIFLAAIALLLFTGCINKTFVYKPGVAVTSGTKLPVKVAVLPLKDGTENFTQRGGLFPMEVYNLAKDAGPLINGLPPEYWSKALADEMAASGRFESVRFVYDRSELTDENYIVEGILEKVYLDVRTPDKPHEFALSLWAQRKADKRTTWERDIRKEFKSPTGIVCITGQCEIDRFHVVVNRAMQEMFAEAGKSFAETLAPLLTSRDEAETPALPKPTDAPESVDKTIEGILKGQ